MYDFDEIKNADPEIAEVINSGNEETELPY